MTTRQKTIYFLAGLAGIILVVNLYRILLVLTDEVQQGAIYRIIYFHLPAAFTGFTMFLVSLIASVGYLATKRLRWDGIASSAVEVGLVFASINLLTGMIWARIIWGIWWTWDARLTSMFVCWLLYASYLVLRTAVDDAGQRATISAVLAIFSFADVPIVYGSIYWWRTQHPQPVLTTGKLAAEMWPPLLMNFGAFLLIAVALMLVRLDQEETRLEIHGLRRLAHAL
jgi:heme exporter protein C